MQENPPAATLAAMLEVRSIRCPYCGETIETRVDASGGNQEYIEDCQVCCRPIVLRITTDGGGLGLEIRREDD